MNRYVQQLLVAVVLVSVGVGAFTASAGAASVEADTDFTGGDDSDLAITTTVRVTTDVVSNNVTINVNTGNRSFVDFSSFSTTRPGGASIEVRNPAPGTYIINELSPGQEWVITFTAYPTTISEETIEIARVRRSSEQQPTTQVQSVTASLNDSSYFRLQENRRLVEEQNQTIQGLSNRLQLFPFLVGGGGLFGLVGLAAAGWFYRESSADDELSDARREFLSKLRWELIEGSLQNQNMARQKVASFRQELAEQWGIDVELINTGTGPWDTDDEGGFGGAGTDSSGGDGDDGTDAGDGFGDDTGSGFGSDDDGGYGDDERDSGF